MQKVNDCVLYDREVVIIQEMEGDKITRVGGPHICTSGNDIQVYKITQTRLQLTRSFHTMLDQVNGRAWAKPQLDHREVNSYWRRMMRYTPDEPDTDDTEYPDAEKLSSVWEEFRKYIQYDEKWWEFYKGFYKNRD